MKKYITLLTVLFCCCCAVQAQLQPSFHRGFFDPAGQVSYNNDFDLVEAGNGDFLFPFSEGGIMRTSPTGKPLWAARFTTLSGTGLQRAIFNQVVNVSGGDQLLFGALTDTAAKYIRTWDTPVICRVDAAGALVWSKILPSSPGLTYSHSKSIRAANGDILMCMGQGTASSEYLLMTRMTEHGTIIWQRMLFNDTNVLSERMLGVWDISECASGDFVFVGAGTKQNSNIVAKINSLGNIHWVRKLQDRLGGTSRVPWKVREMPDGNVRVVIADPFQHTSTGGNSKYGMAYFTIGPFGNISGAGKAFENSPYSATLIRPDGSMLFGGFNLLYVSDSGVVRFYNDYHSGVWPVFRTVLATADGGFAAAGGYHSGSGNIVNGYLLKTDSLGNALPITAPRVTSDTFYDNTFSYFMLRDSAVSIPLQKSTGITLTRVPFTLHDTLFTTTVSVPFVTGSDGLQIYPNPATTIVYLNASLPMNVEILAATGRLVLEQKAVRSVDVSALPAGTYFLRIRDETGRTLAIRKLLKQ